MSDQHAPQGARPAKGHGHRGGHHDDHGHGGHEEGHEGAPEWLISFADNVVLMMGFFVILLAMNMAPKGDSHASEGHNENEQGKPPAEPDMVDAVIAIREAFHNPVNVDSPRPQDAELVRRILERSKAPDVLDDGPSGKDKEVNSVRPSNYHKLAAAVDFEVGATDLSLEARRTIAQTAAYLRGMRNIVEVVGHTSAAESNEDPQLAIRLSFDRALSVAAELARNGMDWGQIKIVAASDKDRIVERAYSPGQQRVNQRVEIMLTEKLFTD